MTVTDEEIRAVYREERSIRRTCQRVHVAETRVARAVADLTVDVSGRRLSSAAVLMKENRAANRIARAMMRSSWRCYECLARAKGDTCANGHPAPWVDLKEPH